MKVSEFFLLPELPPIESGLSPNSFGLAVPKIEGEHVVEAWQTEDGRAWWSETIDGVRYRRTYA